jgi:Ca2+-binding RTX toxin-like protein
VPAGTVTFSDGTSTLATVDVNSHGQATFDTNLLTPGLHRITATYNGAPGYLSSTGSAPHLVTGAEQRLCSTDPITVPDSGTATPYPSTIDVSGAGVLDQLVTVELVSFSHSYARDARVMLVSPTGQNLVLMSGVGYNTVDPVDLMFFDGASRQISGDDDLTSGTYLPSNRFAGEVWPEPAPTASNGTTLSTFRHHDANGRWKLFVVDDVPGDGGSIGRWCLSFATGEKGATDTALTSSPNPSLAGEEVTFTARVTTDGDPVTDGTVTFTDDTTDTVLATGIGLDPKGAAAVALDTLTVGDHEITASYSGTAVFAASDDVLTHAVDEAESNHSPVGEADAYATSEDTRLTVAGIGVLGNDTDPDDGALTAILGTAPIHGTVALDADGSFTYTPAPNFHGADRFTYRARNEHGAESAVVRVSLTVRSVDDAPTIAISPAFSCRYSSAKLHVLVDDVDDQPSSLVLTASTSAEGIRLAPTTAGSRRRLTISRLLAPMRETLDVRVSDGTKSASTSIALVVGTSAADRLTGTPGPDFVFGRRGRDDLYGSGGNDLMCGPAGADVFHGGPGADALRGGIGPDLLFGGPGADTLHGREGDDNLLGGPGNDVLRGDTDDDVLRGGRGDDRLRGGPGADYFVGRPGTDTSVDFDASQGDRRRLR